ncbi:cysteine protease ATG4D isoform X4 [Corvus hawaiiensis]|uniref:cysteine protease ATG4D isoform X4 n=1 Tax=Corvus hawaiiensis TaxID=134902 RepID=UPI0020193B57|nr:cysteine protease ATG4D isoform X4 [Corvus hawaiiensis]
MSGGGEGPGPPPGPAPGSAPGPAPGPPPGAERGGQRVRGRVLAAWNSVKYGWTLRPRPHFSPRDPLYLLGRVYAPGNGEELARFRRDFCSRLWFTYRSGFPALPGTPRTTDCGWGCTLRSAQMLLGQGLVLHLLGRVSPTPFQTGRGRRRCWNWNRGGPGGAVTPQAGHGTPRDGHGLPGMAPGFPGMDMDPPGRTPDPLGGHGTPLGCTQDPPGRMRPPQNGQGPPGVDTGRPRMDTESLGGTRDPSGQARDPPEKLRDPPGRTRPPPGSPRAPRDAEQRHRAIVSWFSDHPRAPFGIHRLVELGREFGKSAGDWFGPAIAAHLLRGAVESCTETPGLAVYVAQDCTVYKGDVARLVRGDPEGGTAGPGAPGHGTPGAPGASGHGTPGSGTPGAPGQRRGLVLLVPARLGGESLNPVYVECVKELLQLRSCLGIIGGKPRHSLFFLGFQGDSLLYLDPHLCQASVDTAREKFPLQSFHCCFPRKMPFGKMDPSCTFGFYAGGTELEQLWGDLARVLAPPSAPERYPIFTLAEGHAQDQALDTPPGPPPSLPRQGKRPKKPNSDEFVFL